MSYRKVGFYGLGLIGGSIAKAIRERHTDISMIATSGHPETVAEAYAAGVIENETMLSPDAFSDCDLIFLCAPVSQNIAFLSELQPFVRPGALITDVGSVKGTIHEEALRLSLSDRFIGGHPMTGSERTGFANARASLLENAYYLLTPEDEVPETAVTAFEAFVRSLGAIPLLLDAAAHDRATAAVSHLPHVVASALVRLVSSADDEEILKQIAAGGFRDITRIASGSPAMWESICLENREQILSLLDSFSGQLSDIRSKIDASDAEAIRSFFSAAKNYRDSLNVRTKSGSLVHELYSELSDNEGQIANVTTILASRHINIKNIGILHNREYEQGVLHMEFYDADALQAAQQVLTENGYVLYLR